LQELLEAVVEERLTVEQLLRLEQLVLERAEARRFYVEYLHQHACLHWSGAGLDSENPVPAVVSPVRTADPTEKPSRRRLYAGGLLAASLLLALAVWFLQR